MTHLDQDGRERRIWVVAMTVMPVDQRLGTVEILAGDDRTAVHPRTHRTGRHFPMASHGEDLSMEDGRARREALAVQVPIGAVERFSLAIPKPVAAGGPL